MKSFFLQAWAAPGSVVANLVTSPYTPVVETMETTKNRRHYLSPKEKGNINFMERMRGRNSKLARLRTETGDKVYNRDSISIVKNGYFFLENLKVNTIWYPITYTVGF